MNLLKTMGLGLLASTLFFASQALHAAAGSLLWEGTIQAGFTWSTPTVVNDVVYVQDQEGGIDAFNTSNGSLSWHKNIDSSWPTTSTTYSDGYIYLSTGTTFYKLDPSNGAILNSYTGDSNFSAYVGAPAVDDQYVYFHTHEGVVALNKADLSVAWSNSSVKGVVAISSHNGTVYCFGTNLTALNTADGAERWNIPAPDSASFKDGALNDNYLVAFDENQLHGYQLNGNSTPGIPIWSVDMSGYMVAAPAIDNGIVFANSAVGTLKAINLTTGTVLWTQTVRSSGSAPAIPTAVGGQVFIQSEATGSLQLTAFDGQTGSTIWQTAISDMGISWGAPILVDGVAYMAVDHKGKVYAVDAGSVAGNWYMYKQNPSLTGSDINWSPSTTSSGDPSSNEDVTTGTITNTSQNNGGGNAGNDSDNNCSIETDSVASWTNSSSAEMITTQEGIVIYGEMYRGNNRIESVDTFDVVGKNVYLKWQASGAGQFGSPWVGVSSLSSGFFTLDHSWNSSVVINPSTWYYSRIKIQADGTYERATSTDNYDDADGTVIFSDTGSASETVLSTVSEAKIYAGLNDNYGGTDAFTLVAEAFVGDCGNSSDVDDSDDPTTPDNDSDLQTIAGIDWLAEEPDGYFSWQEADQWCQVRGARLPLMDELIAVWNDGGGSVSPYGFEKDTFYWAQEDSDSGSHQACAMDYNCSAADAWQDNSNGHPKCVVNSPSLAGSGSSGCAVSLSSSLAMHIPVLEYQSAQGSMSLYADLEYVSLPHSPDIQFEVSNYNFIDSLPSGCTPATLSGDLMNLHLPKVIYGDLVLSADLEFTPVGDRLIFTVVDYQILP